MKNTYSEMKDSGVAWIGAVPSNWGVLPARTAFYEVKEKNFDGKYTRQLSFRYGQIVDKAGNSATTEAENETASAYRVVTPKTIMINGLNLNYDFISQRVAMVKDHGIITSAYLAVKAKGELMIAEYALYLFKSYDGKQVFHGHGSGVRKTLKFSDFREILVVIPPLPEQTAIAAYLDEKCGTIDEIIAEAKASIEEYKAWKSSVIFEAVTKGLDPNTEMKDSGVEWIGKISKCFQLKKIKSVANIYGRIGFRGYTTEDLVDEGEGAITLSPSNIADGKMNYNKCSYVSWEKYNESPEIMIFNDDVLMVKTGASYGKVAMVENLPNKATINPQLIVFKNIIINRRYFCYVMQTVVIQNQIEGIVSGGTIPTMSQNKLGNLFLLVPNDKLQEKIADYLDVKCAVIDGIIAEKEALIADMEAYKKSLIFETVTGKRKVC